NTWTAVEGSAGVKINGKGVHRLGDMGQHCGGVGKLVQGSPTVNVGGGSASSKDASAPKAPEDRPHWVEMHVVDAAGKALEGRPYVLRLPDGTRVRGVVPADGKVRKDGIPAVACELVVADIEEARWGRHVIGHEELTD